MEFKAQRKLFFTLDPTFEIDPNNLIDIIYPEQQLKFFLYTINNLVM
jgi:hypothetical protein